MGKKIPVWQILLLIVVMVGALMFTVLKKEGYMHGILAMVLCLACIIAMLNGYKWSYLQSAMINKISSSMEAVLIFITVGMLVAMWISGGIVQAMIYYGLKILSPQIFLVASCILCAIVAIATGSSWTTAGTIGVALMGIGVTMGISAPLVAGSIISGAYLGDKMSPLSDTTNLAPAMAGAKLFDHIGHMVWTVTPSLIVSLIIYFILGLGVDTSSATTSDIEALQQVLKDNFNLNPLLFIAPILVVVMAIKKLPALAFIFIGAMVGLIFVPIFQGGSLADAACYELYAGYVSETGDAFVDELLTRGGIESMFYSTSLCLIALAFAGVLESSGMLASLCKILLRVAKTNGLLIMITLFTCIIVNILCADQYISIVLPGAMYKEEFENRRLKAKNLSRCLEDAGTLSSPLIPWTTCSAYMQGALGVNTFAYAPFAFLNWICPLISLFYGFTGISIEKMTEEEYEEAMARREEEQKRAAEAIEA